MLTGSSLFCCVKGAGQSTDANLVDYSVLYDQTVRATLWNEVSIASLAVTCTQEVRTLVCSYMYMYMYMYTYIDHHCRSVFDLQSLIDHVCVFLLK